MPILISLLENPGVLRPLSPDLHKVTALILIYLVQLYGLISLATLGPLCLRITFLRKGTLSYSASPLHTVGALSCLISF